MSQPSGIPTGKNADVPKNPEEFLIAYLKHTAQMIEVATDPEQDDETSRQAGLRIGACIAVSYLADYIIGTGHPDVVRGLLEILDNPPLAMHWIGQRMDELGIDVDADPAP